MDRSWRRWTLRLGTAALLATLAAVWPYRLIGGRATDQLDRMSGELERAREAARARGEQIAELRREVDALQNQTGAIEDIARRELGMIRPGEIVLRFEAGPAPAAGARPAGVPDEDDAPPPPIDGPGAGGAP